MLNKNQTKSTVIKRGGARPNAGRPKGGKTTKTQEIARKAVEQGVSPLEYMLNMMRAPDIETEDAKLLFDQSVMRFEAAKAAAPYVHPRLAAVDMKHGVDPENALGMLIESLSGRAKLIPSGAGKTKR